MRRSEIYTTDLDIVGSLSSRERRRGRAWSVLAQSVRGAAHARRGEPNQDAVAFLPEAGRGAPLILAVSDGHGSPKSFRSDRGARLAVAAAVGEAERLLAAPGITAADAARIARDELRGAVIRDWERRVREDLAAQAFTAAERKRFTAQYGAPAWKALRSGPLLAYGATLLLAVATTEFLLVGQIGDGDIVAVTRAGCATRPLRADPRLFGGDTTSLCLENAAESFALCVAPAHGDRPALILIATDGCANSFEDDGGFLSVGADLLMMLREHDAATVQSDLGPWLEEVSRDGSGDDITVGALCLL
ncbi:MAG TPA: PP2C family serine/threonine-protein phosphatase [Chthonomonadaceae bacterium]|nr:PP2C family serine/threonine-protein phosphatase [Chthonomonadaceae bacterium]